MRFLEATDEAIRAAGFLMKQGGVVVYPTETVYGLGCVPSDTDASQRVCEIKQRADKPLPLICADISGGEEDRGDGLGGGEACGEVLAGAADDGAAGEGEVQHVGEPRRLDAGCQGVASPGGEYAGEGGGGRDREHEREHLGWSSPRCRPRRRGTSSGTRWI